MNPLTEKVLGVSCSGLECTHELGEKHWVVTEDDIAKIHTLIREETVKECVEALPRQNEEPFIGHLCATMHDMPSLIVCEQHNQYRKLTIDKLQALTKIS